MHSLIEELRQSVDTETEQRRMAECMAHIQSDVMQRSLDLLVREPDNAGFFRGFMLLHGFPYTWEVWGPIMPRLAATC